MKKIVIAKLKTSNLKNIHAGVIFDQWNFSMREETDIEDTSTIKEKACNLQIFQEDNTSYIGNIYIGHVRDVVKNIEAAFVEFCEGTVGYLSLKNINPVFLNKKNTDKVCEGDNIIVQVAKDRIRTKDAVLTGNFELAGRFLVITHGKTGISVSAKIRDEQYKKEIREKLENFMEHNLPVASRYSVIVRTEGYHAGTEEIEKELLELNAEYQRIIELAETRQKYYLLKLAEMPVLRFVKSGIEQERECEIVTDDEKIYKYLSEQKIHELYQGCRLRFYEDALLPLYKLYNLEGIFYETYSSKVWLKSGAFLVIEYTEALTVIDVNTGKCERGKSKETTFFQINLEAALEIARQIRIRNISGIIIVDFIDMETEEYTKRLLEYMKEIVNKDSVKTTVVDITKLHLMEITRKKTTDRIQKIEQIF